jgi:hypothetical protein
VDESAGTILSLACLQRLDDAARALANLSAAYGVAAWHGEGANCWEGGRRGLTDSYTDLFYSARALTATEGRGVATYIRQTLVGALAAQQPQATGDRPEG